MSEYSESVGIMYPANWPEDKDDAHCTLIYLGDKEDVNASKKDVVNLLKGLSLMAPGEVRVASTSFFGESRDIPVVLLDSSLLHLQRVIVEKQLKDQLGVVNGSQFTTYQPHVTVESNRDYILPTTITLGKPQLWWGDEYIEV